MKKIMYIAMGVVLLIGSIATGNYGLSDEDKAIYEMALEQQDQVETLGFDEFRLADYPVAFFDGNYDYVVHAKEGSYSVEKRNPVLNTFAGTAYEVDGHYEVIVPTIDQFEGLLGVATSAQKMKGFADGSDASLDENAYGEEEQVATIWHEAFHAYQMTSHMQQIEELLAGHIFSEEDLQEQLIVEQIDEDEAQCELYEKQLSLLKKAVNTTEVDTIKENILQYQALEEQRMASLSEEVKILESYYKHVEGSAHYVEAMVYKNLHSEEEFQARYVENMDVFQGGSGKYYTIGMAECLILDKICEDWKSDYDFSKSFMELICEALEM